MNRKLNILTGLLILLLTASCSREDKPIVEEEEYEATLNFSVDGFTPSTRAPSYSTVIQHTRILAFRVSDGLLFRQIVIPAGAGAPTTLRLPMDRYYIVFLGNFTNLMVTPGTTTMDDLLVSMTADPAYPGATDVFVAPTLPYYYYMTGIVQFGIVANITATLKPVTSQLILQYQNKPTYYTTLKADVRGIGKSLSLRGSSLLPAVRLIKTRSGLLGVGGTVSDTTYTFSSVGGYPYIRLYATDNLNNTDSLDFTFSQSVLTGNAYKIYFIFPSAPELTKRGLKGVRMEYAPLKE